MANRNTVYNLVSVTDWAGRTTAYTYDENNRAIGVTKPDGSTTTTVYDDKQRIVSTVEKLADDTIISGFEYEYDEIGRISSEKVLAKNEKMCYTYDEQSRVTKRTIVSLSGSTETEECFTYDAAGNITEDNSFDYTYDTNNRLIEFKGNPVSYDLDGNMLSNGSLSCAYDSGNRLISAGDHIYTYNAENVRIRNLCTDAETTYVYNTNCKLSQLLMKTTNGITTKYVYGLGLIGEEKCGEFKIYHFDYRGSTVAITDANGTITDTFTYDTYGKLISRTGNSFVIFGYNGRDGVVTDKNGLIYMRARYYSPELRRFVNADVIAGSLDNAITLNRFAYANGNPVSFVDPFGLSAERGYGPTVLEAAYMADHIYDATLYDKLGGRIQSYSHGKWELLDIKKNSGGLKMGLYAKTFDDGTIGYVIANAGSETKFGKDYSALENVESAIDWLNNIIQPYGASPDMKDSIKFATAWANQYTGSPITFVGHSKGGGEAIANAIATNRNAITFNPATPRFTKYDLSLRGYTGDITNYVVEGEILNTLLTFAAENAPKWRDGIGNLEAFAKKAGLVNENAGAQLTALSYLLDTIVEGLLLDPVGKVEKLYAQPNVGSVDKHLMDTVIPILEQ